MGIVKISDLPLVDSPVEGTDLFVVVQNNVTKKAFASDIQTYVGFEEFQTATAGQTVFNLTTMTYAAGANNLMVFVDGVNQYEGLSYVETDNNTVTFTQGLHLGAVVKFSTVQTQTSSVASAGAVTFLQAGTGAVARSVQSKERDVISVKDFGAIADATYNGITKVATGTDNLAAFTAAFNAAVSLGITRVHAPGGVYYFSGKLTLPRGIILEGDGTGHLPFFLSGPPFIRGTCLIINGAAGDDCLAFQENAGHSELREISVYNTNTNAIRSVVSIIGQLYPKLMNVEIASLAKTTGAGLYIAPSSVAPNFETLFGAFHNVIVMPTEVGQPYEASVRWGLVLYGFLSNRVPNANSFVSGEFSGTWGGLLIDAAIPTSLPLSNVFHGVKFGTNWDGTFTPVFKAAAANVFGFSKNNCYIFPLVRINNGDGTAFHGCYFEAAGFPATYNDGVNGSASLLPVMWIDNATSALRTGAVNCNWNTTYLYDAGTQTNVSPTTNGFRHDNSLGAVLLLRQAATQSIPNAAQTKVQFNTVLQGDDSNLEWDAANYQVKIRQPGIYAITAQVGFSGWATAGTYAVCRVNAGGYTINGSYAPQIGAGNPVTTTVNTCLSLATGETINLEVLQNEGNAQSLAANLSTLSVVKIA
jgi:hypothetical protein